MSEKEKIQAAKNTKIQETEENEPVKAASLGLRREDPMEEIERRRARSQMLRMKNRVKAHK